MCVLWCQFWWSWADEKCVKIDSKRFAFVVSFYDCFLMILETPKVCFWVPFWTSCWGARSENSSFWLAWSWVACNNTFWRCVRHVCLGEFLDVFCGVQVMTLQPFGGCLRTSSHVYSQSSSVIQWDAQTGPGSLSSRLQSVFCLLPYISAEPLRLFVWHRSLLLPREIHFEIVWFRFRSVVHSMICVIFVVTP